MYSIQLSTVSKLIMSKSNKVNVDLIRTAFNLPFAIVFIGCSIISSPSTTGTTTTVPKKPALLIAKFAVSSNEASTRVRHAKLLPVFAQLMKI